MPAMIRSCEFAITPITRGIAVFKKSSVSFSTCFLVFFCTATLSGAAPLGTLVA